MAGFNQFFADGEGIDAWHYGLAWDQRFPVKLYGGIAIHRRDLDVPFGFISDTPAPIQARTATWEEQVLRAYLYWAPHTKIALGAEYRFEDLERDEEFLGNALFKSIQTHRFPLGFSYFHPHSIIGRLSAIYVDQEGDFGDPFSGFETDSDQFWVVDAAIGNRLPKRYGMVTLEARNILDQLFKFQDTDPANPEISPERTVVTKVSFSF